LSRDEFRGKAAAGRKTVSQTPGEKDWLTDSVEMGKAPGVINGHTEESPR